MKSGKPGQADDAHRYILWRLNAGTGPGGATPGALIISMGEHGAMVVTAASDQEKEHPASLAGTSQMDVLKHNLAERARAREEGIKWEMRLRGSPLGKTQQDYVAYYAEVDALFAEWCASQGPTPPTP